MIASFLYDALVAILDQMLNEAQTLHRDNTGRDKLAKRHALGKQ